MSASAQCNLAKSGSVTDREYTSELLVEAPRSLQVVEGLGIKEGDLLEFELTAERALRVTVMKSSTVTRKPKKMGVPELQASLAKKKVYRGGMPELSRSMMLTGQEGAAMSDLLVPAAAALQGLPIRLPDINTTQVQLLLCHTDVAFLFWYLPLCLPHVTHCVLLLHVHSADVRQADWHMCHASDVVQHLL